MEPNHTDIKAGLNLLKDVAQEKKGPDVVQEVLPKVANHWADLVSGGATLLSGNRKMTKCVDDLPGFLNQQNGLSTLKAIVATRGKILKTHNALRDLHDRAAKELTGIEYDQLAPLEELLGKELPPAWEAELSTHELSTKLTNGLDAHYEKKKAEGVEVIPDHDYFEALASDAGRWCKDVAEDATLEDVFSAAKQTLLQFVPYNAVNDFAEAFCKACAARCLRG